MIKSRIIGVVLVNEHNFAVQSIGFKRYLPIGKPEIAINYLENWGIDEIAVLHIDATRNQTKIPQKQVEQYAKQGQVPLSVGGGINHVDDIKRIIQAGADKVVINSALIAQPDLISECAEQFGRQCIIVSIDAIKDHDGNYKTYYQGKMLNENLQDTINKAEKLGAGELLITSVNQDGMKKGYDVELYKQIMGITHVPIIACGGAGHPDHMKEIIHCGASAVAAANFFHFTEHSVITVKRCLQSTGEPIRLDSYTNYEQFNFDNDGRIDKLSDEVLDTSRFHYVPEEII